MSTKDCPQFYSMSKAKTDSTLAVANFKSDFKPQWSCYFVNCTEESPLCAKEIEGDEE